MLSLATAHLVELFCANIFFGIHLCTFFVSLWIQMSRVRNTDRTTNWLLVAVTLAMGTIGTLTACVNLAFVNQVFVVGDGDTSLFMDLSYWMNIVEDSGVTIQPLIGDAMLIYRLWAIYGRRWIIIVPFVVIWFGTASVVVAIIVFTITSPVSNGYNAPRFTPFNAAALVLTVANNIFTTSLIVYRLWTTMRKSRTYVVGRHRSSFVMRIVIESGVLYTATAIILLGVAAAKNNVDYIVAGSFVQVTGIAFNLIIIRVSYGLAAGDDSSPCPHSGALALDAVRAGHADRASEGHTVRAVQIHISQNTEISSTEDETKMLDE